MDAGKHAHGIPVSPWGTETMYDSGEAYFDHMIAAIDVATSSVELETYIFDLDPVGQRVARALLAAHGRGVRVRVLMDGAGCYHSSTHFAELLSGAGIEVKIYHPLPWQIHLYRHSLVGGSWLNKFLYFVRRINQRDHRKLCIVDQERLWSGSFNITSLHLEESNGGGGWRDYGLSVSGPLVAEIHSNFNSLWQRGSVPLGKGLFKAYWSNLTRFARRRRNRLLLKHISSAVDKIWIVSAYFAPAYSVVRALRKARKRGVDVRLIVPQRSDIKWFPLLTATYYADLLRDRIRVYEYQRAMIHAKAVIIDDLHMIGSTNFNHRSFLHDLELDVQLHQQRSKETLCQWFVRDMHDSIEVSGNPARPIVDQLLGTFAKLIRYWA